MDVMEKLVELIRCADYHPCGGSVRKIGSMFTTEFIEDIASQLIANGVTVQENVEISDDLLKQLKNAPITICKEEPSIELVHEWISVKDSLPHKNMRVLACYTFDGYMQFVQVLDYYATDKKPHFQHEGDGMRVTHWMPIPKPPKGE